MAEKNITKKCRACEIDFSRLKDKKPLEKSDYHFPANIPVSDEMKKSVYALMGKKYRP